MVSYYGISDRGCVREENEDRLLIAADLGCFVVADGMGGHRHGEIAAELAITTLRHYLESSRDRPDVTWPFGYNLSMSVNANRLATGIRLANRQVWKRAEEGPEFAGMGSTIAAVLVSRGEAAVANVGDSRVYLLRSGELTQLTTDDTWLNAVIQQGMRDKIALEKHPMRNVLTQAAGSQSDIDVHTADLELLPGDVLLLATDGLHGVVSDGAICAILSSYSSPEEKARLLVESAKAAGGPDNVACIVVNCGE